MFDIDKFLHANAIPASPKWSGYSKYNFVGGHNDDSMIPIKDLDSAAHRAITANGVLLAQYNPSGPLGYPPLRDFIVDKLRRGSGIQCTKDDILVVSGSLQALDLVNATLLSQGDTVIVEESSYGGVFSRLKQLKVNVVGIPVNDDGLDLNVLEDTLIDLGRKNVLPRYIYTIPTVQNPTGVILPYDKRIKMLELSKKFGVPIFEDDCYADLLWGAERPASIRSLDEEGSVIYCGSFSKSVAPGFRVGYIVADWNVLSRILPHKNDGGTGMLEQMILAEFCGDGFFAHLEKLKNKLRSKAEVMCESFDKYFKGTVSYKKPIGGIFLWVNFLQSIDTNRLSVLALEKGVSINPGQEWSLEASNKTKIRVCYAYPKEDAIDIGVERLAGICKSEFKFVI